MTELEKLKKYLDEHGYVSRWNSIQGENDQIIVYVVYDGSYDIDISWPGTILDNGRQCIRSWDVISYDGSYGGKDGLLEIYGSIVEDVDGWLTAEDVIKKYLENGGKNNG